MHFDLGASVVPISRVNSPAWVGKAGAEDKGETQLLGHRIGLSRCLEFGFVWRNSSTKLGSVWREFLVLPKTARYRSSEGRGKH